MATFTALNIEPDYQVDDEVDNTKEIQIEDALKLYQTALKLHSQGPLLYPQAAEAYSSLFKSDIFKYPESITEFTRIDEHPELELVDTSFPLDLDLAAAEADASSLPQILFLSYKNHGQFILDCVKSRLLHPDLPSDQQLNKAALRYQGHAALENFALALARDESDTELWRRTARIASMIGSKRLARYCLEAAVEVDDDPTVAEVEPASIEEGFAGEQLKEQLKVISDGVALSHPIMAPFRKKSMPAFLTKHMDPYAYLPDSSRLLGPEATDENPILSIQNSRITLPVPEFSWTALGDALVMLSISPQGVPSTGMTLQFPEISEGGKQGVGASQPQVEDTPMQGLDSSETPLVENPEDPAITPSAARSDDQPAEPTLTTAAVPLNDGGDRSQTIALPTRKRSQSSAGIRDTPEDDSGTQKRSKRIRNRDTTLEAINPEAQYAEQLQTFEQADNAAFGFVDKLLKEFGVDDLGTLSDLRVALTSPQVSDPAETISNTAVRDLWDMLRTWDDNKASTFQNASAAEVLGSSSAGGANAGLAAFLEHSKSGPPKISTRPIFDATGGLSVFCQKVDTDWVPVQDAIFEWLRAVLQSYQYQIWPEELKGAVVRIISFADPEIFSRIQMEVDRINSGSVDDGDLPALQELTQTLFELHLDIYSRITNPNSIIHYETRVATKDRLDRWAGFAASVIRPGTSEPGDDLSLRYLWASVFYATMTEDVSREHKVLCWSDLQSLLSKVEKPIIELQNNAVMPEISAAAAEREVSRLTTMDFFYNLFQTDTSNPAAIIETLEPVLDPESACESTDSGAGETSTASEASDSTPAVLREMWKFLKTGSTSLRLFLWQRLREAYFSIGYTTKVFSCYLKSIEIIVTDMRSEEYVHSADEPRQHQMLLWLKALDDLLVKSLTLALNDTTACFEIIDDRHLKSTCSAVAQLSRILHAAAIFDDEVRVGMTQLPQTPAYAPHNSFSMLINKLREMQVRAWSLQYAMVKEAMAQNRELFLDPDTILADFLTHVHYPLGLRKFCKASNKIFLKMMKVELIRLKPVDRWEDYFGQVLYDIYGLRLGVGTYLIEEHGCPTETLDRRTVLNIAEPIIALAKQMSLKDLLKHDLRTAIERMQTAIGPAKSTPQMTHNLRNITEYLKGSIRPLQLYQAFKGRVEIDSIPVLTQDNGLAEKGWYFLQGMIAMTKFRSQKRLGPSGQTDDMRVSATFMRLQLQYTADQWETWYRLAQCFDFELEDEVMWSADKVNHHRPDLVRMQRGAIHCYIMALSTAVRTADDSSETAAKLSEMYHNFGMRLYASSREPFGMEAFWVDEFEKHFSGAQGMYKKRLHEELSRYKLWKYASRLFKKAMMDNATNWMNHFMLGKCLWKMHCEATDTLAAQDHASRPSKELVLDAFLKAIKTVPKPKDNRQEPILEPHYKLVSIVHKLVARNEMEPQAGADLLQEQPYKIRKGERIEIKDLEEWKPFLLESLRHLRNADKQHWHHRMVARVADVLYDDTTSAYDEAAAARSEFRESIFTKTMHVQVWKPEAERPGRHCVYMERYVRFMVKLLATLGDKVNMEALVKRVRKKGTEFYHFNTVWNESCTVYLRLIRQSAEIPLNMDEAFKNVPLDEFEVFSERLAQWVNMPDLSHRAVIALRETIELKKLNVNQMKSTPIDDLINDIWAVLYTEVADGLFPDPTGVRQSLRQAHIDGANGAGSRRAIGPMSVNTLVMNMDGTQIPVPVTFASSSESSRPWKVGVPRREVLRKAESAINRAPEPPRQPTSTAARRRTSEPNSAGARSSGARPYSSSTPRVEVRAVQNVKDEERFEDSKAEGEQSAPGSLHDSADDESDLSDVPDLDESESAMFPGLGREDGQADEGQTEEVQAEDGQAEDDRGEEAEAETANGTPRNVDTGAEHESV